MTSSKKKKAQRADFKRTKTKLGKKLVPQNSTDTSYSSKAIHLPSQSFAVDKEGIPRTKRNQTLDDLLAHLGHPSDSTRTEALAGLTELFELHPWLGIQQCSRTLQAAIKLLPHPSTQVRKALLVFLDRYLARISLSTLLPSVDTILQYTASALSHIHQDIRLDALQLLDQMLNLVPERVTEGWPSLSGSSGFGVQFLHALLALLHIKSGPNSTAGSWAPLNLVAKSKVYFTMAHFFQAALSKLDIDDDCWFYATAIARHSDFRAFTQDIVARQGRLPSLVLSSNLPASHAHPFPFTNAQRYPLEPLAILNSALQPTSTSTESVWTPSSLVTELEPHIRSALHDAPSAANPAIKKELLGSTMRMARDLWRAAILREDDPSKKKKALLSLGKFLKASSAQFPNSEATDVDELEWSLVHCQLAALLALNTEAAQSSIHAVLLEQSKTFVTRLLQSSPGRNHHFESLQPIVWALLTLQPDRLPFLQDVLNFNTSCPASQETEKLASFQFISNLLLLEGRTTSSFNPWTDEESTVLVKWTSKLPQVIFQAASSGAILEVVLRNLLQLFQERDQQVQQAFADPATLRQFAAFFAWEREHNGQTISGSPFKSTTSTAQQLALSLVQYLDSRSEDLERAIAKVQGA